MQRLIVKASGTVALLGLLTAAPASAALLFSTGNPDGKIATPHPPRAISSSPPRTWAPFPRSIRSRPAASIQRQVRRRAATER